MLVEEVHHTFFRIVGFFCASSYKGEFTRYGNVAESEPTHATTGIDPDCRATGLDVTENPPQALARSDPAVK